ncbi:hypothetical protein WSS15_01880 [Acetobacter pasteurianus]|nr:hypothetical protein WSS15_01880 [Acetobacter pasteurianus]
MDFYKHLHVRKAAHGGVAEGEVQLRGNGFGKWEVAVTGDDFHDKDGSRP